MPDASLLPARYVMVTGSRKWPEDSCTKVFDVLDDALHHVFSRKHRMVLLHGGAVGVDSLAAEWADDPNGPVETRVFKPDYDQHGSRAPHVRNDEMLDLAEHVIAFWDGKSRGTKSVIDKAIKRGLSYEIHSPAGVYVEV